MSLIINKESPSGKGLGNKNTTGYMCKHCGRVASKSQIILHILRAHRKSTEVPFACALCNFISNDLSLLGKIKLFNCFL